MRTEQEASTPGSTQGLQSHRVTSRQQQMTLSLFPSAPGRPMLAAVAHASTAPRLRPNERAGDSQRTLPIRGLPSV